VVKRWQQEWNLRICVKRCKLLSKWCFTKDTWLILHICS
jgi:hypothetical protein